MSHHDEGFKVTDLMRNRFIRHAQKPPLEQRDRSELAREQLFRLLLPEVPCHQADTVCPLELRQSGQHLRGLLRQRLEHFGPAQGSGMAKRRRSHWRQQQPSCRRTRARARRRRRAGEEEAGRIRRRREEERGGARRSEEEQAQHRRVRQWQAWYSLVAHRDNPGGDAGV